MGQEIPFLFKHLVSLLGFPEFCVVHAFVLSLCLYSCYYISGLSLYYLTFLLNWVVRGHSDSMLLPCVSISWPCGSMSWVSDSISWPREKYTFRMPLPCFSKLNSESIICTSTGVLANFYRIYVNKPNVKYTWLYRF